MDLRVDTGFLRHVKTRRLKARHGAGAVLGLIGLWSFLAEQRPDASLCDMTEDEISAVAGYDGNPAEWIEALVDVGFLDRSERGLVCHDWADHNTWALGIETRKARSLRANLDRWYHSKGETCGHPECESCKESDKESNKDSNKESNKESNKDSGKDSGKDPNGTPLTTIKDDPRFVTLRDTTTGAKAAPGKSRRKSQRQIEIDEILEQIDAQRPGTAANATRSTWEKLLNEFGAAGLRNAVASVSDWGGVENPVAYLRTICNTQLDRGRPRGSDEPVVPWS